MKYRAVIRDGKVVWEGGQEPSPKPIGVCAFHGWERADFRLDYRVNNDKYDAMPDAGEWNVKFAEHVLQQDRNDCRKLPREKKVMIHGI